MLINQRIIWKDDTTENDLSVNLNNFRSNSETIALVADEDAIYIASDLPFNHRWIEVETENDQAAAPTVAIWFSNEWVSAVDIIDQTASSDVTLAQSGILQWRTDRQKGWDRELDSEDVSGVSKVGIYDMYWIRLGFSADLAASTAIKYIGHKFATDAVLYTFYPDLNSSNIMTAFASGKTDWKDQHFMAAEDIIQDLRKADIIRGASQILDYEIFEEVAVHKCAEIIYRGMGRAYEADRAKARKEYNESFNMTFYNTDLDGDGNLSDRERRQRSGFVGR